MMIHNHSVILFQGDSITDGDRFHEEYGPMGYGYVMMAASWFSALHTEINADFINKGINGSRIVDLKNRWEDDCIKLNPSIVTIMIGINDCWKRYSSNDPTSLEKYESDYRDILTRTCEQTNAEIILMEPFVLPYPADRKDWREDLDPKINVVHQLAREFNALLIPLDEIFSKAAIYKKCEHWVSDGVHPTMAGHALIAKEWLLAVGGISFM